MYTYLLSYLNTYMFKWLLYYVFFINIFGYADVQQMLGVLRIV